MRWSAGWKKKMKIKSFWCPKPPRLKAAIKITGLAGLEPTTYGLGNRRSIRLSYSPIAAIIPCPDAGHRTLAMVVFS
jgi:hypothetical protein